MLHIFLDYYDIQGFNFLTMLSIIIYVIRMRFWTNVVTEAFQEEKALPKLP